jgi:hypothetical protein
MDKLYVSLLLIFAAFGAFCFNMGHRRAYKVVLKALLKGQIVFLTQRIAFFNENRETITQEELTKAYYSYETIGQLILGWYKYFSIVRDDKELHILKGKIRQMLEEYLSSIESIPITKG